MTNPNIPNGDKYYKQKGGGGANENQPPPTFDDAMAAAAELTAESMAADLAEVMKVVDAADLEKADRDRIFAKIEKDTVFSKTAIKASWTKHGGGKAKAKAHGKANKYVYSDEDRLCDALNAVASFATLGSQFKVITELSENDHGKLSMSDARSKLAQYQYFDGNDLKDGFDIWMRHPRRLEFEGITLDPSKPHRQGLKYNIWRGLAMTPSKEGSCDLMLDHIYHVVCGGNQVYFDYYLTFFAQLIQEPEKKHNASIVLIGEKGAGKSLPGQWIQSIIGDYHSCEVSNIQELLGEFNVIVADSIFCQVEELYWPGDHKSDGQFKQMLSGKKVIRNEKHLSQQRMPSFTRYYITTNAQFAIPATAGERRYFVLYVPHPFPGRPIGDPEAVAYFDALQYEVENGGLACWMDFLMDYDISHVNLRYPPATEELKRQQIMNFTPDQDWLFDLMTAGSIPNSFGLAPTEWDLTKKTWVATTQLQEAYGSRIKTYAGGQLPAMRKIIGAFAPYAAIQPHREGVGDRVCGYYLPPLEEARKAFADKEGVVFKDAPIEMKKTG